VLKAGAALGGVLVLRLRDPAAAAENRPFSQWTLQPAQPSALDLSSSTAMLHLSATTPPPCTAGAGGEGKKKKKKKKKKSKKAAAGEGADGAEGAAAAAANGGGGSGAPAAAIKAPKDGKQTDPPTVPVRLLFPDGKFPEGEWQVGVKFTAGSLLA
jgi:hypothetical protein